jgi:hypothetical protein
VEKMPIVLHAEKVEKRSNWHMGKYMEKKSNWHMGKYMEKKSNFSYGKTHVYFIQSECLRKV